MPKLLRAVEKLDGFKGWPEPNINGVYTVFLALQIHLQMRCICTVLANPSGLVCSKRNFKTHDLPMYTHTRTVANTHTHTCIHTLINAQSHRCKHPHTSVHTLTWNKPLNKHTVANMHAHIHTNITHTYAHKYIHRRIHTQPYILT